MSPRPSADDVLVHVDSALQRVDGCVDRGVAIAHLDNRAGMVATVRSSGPTSASSSHVTGAETSAPAFGRTL
jgi:hypothetical protein